MKKIKLRLTAEDVNQKITLNVNLIDKEDEQVKIDEFHSACVQLAYGMGYSGELIKEIFNIK